VVRRSSFVLPWNRLLTDHRAVAGIGLLLCH
jgi:hypothetical protein